MVKIYFSLLLALSAAGCAASAQVGQNTSGLLGFASAFPPDHQPLEPTPKLKVGQIYRRGGAEKPAITINGSKYTPLCPADFKEMRGLNNITLTEEKSVSAFSDSFTAGATASLGGIVLGPLLGNIGAGAKYSGSINMTNMVIVDAGDDILPYVMKNIGPNCRTAIAGNLKNGNPVIIAAQGYRIGEMTVARGNSGNAQIGTANAPGQSSLFPGGGGSFEHNQSVKVENYFISVKPAPVPNP